VAVCEGVCVCMFHLTSNQLSMPEVMKKKKSEEHNDDNIKR